VTWRMSCGSAVRPMTGEAQSGDAVFSWSSADGRGLFAVVDALGHGVAASQSAKLAVSVIERFRDAPLGELFVQVHAALEGRRGAVMSAIHFVDGRATFAGVGNVELLGAADVPRPPCLPGVLGSGRLYLRPAPLLLTPGARWALVSDGLRQRDLRAAWDLAAPLPPGAAAHVLLERAGRPDDDASALLIDFDEETP